LPHPPNKGTILTERKTNFEAIITHISGFVGCISGFLSGCCPITVTFPHDNGDAICRPFNSTDGNPDLNINPHSFTVVNRDAVAIAFANSCNYKNSNADPNVSALPGAYTLYSFNYH
jgi:hypothetical protein